MDVLEQAKRRIICALDFQAVTVAKQFAAMMRSHVGGFKVGPALFTAAGPAIVHHLQRDLGADVFLDLKFHDTPETVAGASESATALGISMFTVHCDGGMPMLRSSRVAVDAAMKLPAVQALGCARPKVLGVIMLTSKQPDDYEADGTIRFHEDASQRTREAVVEEIAMRRSLLIKEIGLDGAIASPRIAPYVRKACGSDFLIVTPGVHIIETAGAAIRSADRIVIGRLFSQSRDPVGVARQIAENMAAALDATKGEV